MLADFHAGHGEDRLHPRPARQVSERLGSHPTREPPHHRQPAAIIQTSGTVLPQAILAEQPDIAPRILVRAGLGRQFPGIHQSAMFAELARLRRESLAVRC